MTADNESVDVVSIAAELLAQVAARVERTAHTDHAVTRQTHSFQGQISHRIHRVRYHDDDSVGRVLEDLCSNALDDAGVYTDELLTCHTRFTGQAGSDNHYVRVSRLAIVVGYALNYGRETDGLSRLHDIHGFAFGYAFLDINQYNFAGDVLYSDHIGGGSTYVTCAYNSYF